jgi:predicted RNA-binding protein with PIN domain
VPILVDGDNLLGTWGRQRSDAQRRELALELGRFGARTGKRVITVFDGSSPGSSAFGANVHFSGAGRTADDLILELLREQPNRRGWLVVTSDRSLGDQCRWLEARIERCDRFRQRLLQTDDQAKPERELDVEYWLEQFGDERSESD